MKHLGLRCSTESNPEELSILILEFKITINIEIPEIRDSSKLEHNVPALSHSLNRGHEREGGAAGQTHLQISGASRRRQHAGDGRAGRRRER